MHTIERAEEKVRSLIDSSRESFDTLKKKSLEDLYHDTKKIIRENPGKSMLGGLAVGILLGTLFRRR